MGEQFQQKIKVYFYKILVRHKGKEKIESKFNLLNILHKTNLKQRMKNSEMQTISKIKRISYKNFK